MPPTLPQTTAQVPKTMPVSATTIAQDGYFFYDPEKTYIFYLDDVTYEVSGEAASYEDIQSMKAVGYANLYTTNSQGHTITISAMISTTQDKIICTVETAAGQANFIARPIN